MHNDRTGIDENRDATDDGSAIAGSRRDAHNASDTPDDDDLERHELTRRQRDVFVVGWSSFLVAAAATMFFFAWVDPLALAEVTELPLPLDRMAGYAIGFFFFWLVSAAAATLSVYLIRTRHGHPPPPPSTPSPRSRSAGD